LHLLSVCQITEATKLPCFILTGGHYKLAILFSPTDNTCSRLTFKISFVI